MEEKGYGKNSNLVDHNEERRGINGRKEQLYINKNTPDILTTWEH